MQTDHATVELISEYDAIVPGQSFDLAVRFDLEEGWHIYWENPGDSGLATVVDWVLPENIVAGEMQWPPPERIFLGGLVNYGYEKEAVFIVTFQAPEDLKLGSELAITADLFWLICKENCLPGEATLNLVLPVASKAEPSALATAFVEARNRQAQAAQPWATTAYLEEEALVVAFEGEALPADFYLYIDTEGLVDPSEDQERSSPVSNRTELRLALDTQFFDNQPSAISGVLQSGTDYWEFNAQIVDRPLAFPVALTELELVGFEQRLLAIGLPGILALAFLGGLILNIMPCVLPVLSLKVFSLLKYAGQARGDALRHGLAYTAGVLISFIALAGALFSLRALGERIGWGFQLQSPSFVVVLSVVFFLFGLNLMGVFELGGRLVGADYKVSRRKDVLGSFGMGILAAVVGAPCMGPLVAGVSGLAVQANIATGLLTFGMMGLGLASPFLVLSVFPKLVAFLPKPGLWMESFKQGMGFLLMAAFVFLALVAGRQGGVDAIFILLVVILLSSIAAWVFGRWGAASRSMRSQWIARLVALFLLGVSLFYGVRSIKKVYLDYGNQGPIADSSGQWGAWSSERVDELLGEGRPVLVDFTATWCLICQVNKKLVLRTDAIDSLFTEKGIVALEADWTRYDSDITDALESFGRYGVPLYLLYTPDGEVTVLPQSLSKDIVRQAIEKALP
ncbi:MAG: protein-disulfide reductase DsbD domain-containing protein [Verrucomicrobiota bacterium]|nr:protein-disulfide reductase DsbD domain-containing protein [Verrucomicrobiota bacterium]